MIELLPHVNVSLNALATVLLIVGYVLIKQKREEAHKRMMLATFAVNVVFLISYLTYHANVLSKKFPTDTEVASVAVRYFYYGLLASHVVLAAFVPVLAVWSIYLGLTNRRESHRRVSQWTWPIWLYVSVTGVIVYLMLYQIFVPLPVG
jgi:putative membrane protein